MMKYLLILIVAFGLIGCGNSEKLPEAAKGYSEGNFELHLEQKVYDELAYNNKRGIYTLTDRSTGKKYLGVSGIGISELGSHTAGKNQTVGDER